MIIVWNEDSTRLMWAASQYNTYHQALVNTMLPFLTPNTRICDAGCGIGALSLALAPYVKEVTAVDISPIALQGLRDRHIPNIRIQCGDIHLLPPDEPYDAMVFCLFGNPKDILQLAKQQCRGTVFLFMKNDSIHRFSVHALCKSTPHYQLTQTLLHKWNIPYELQEFSLEMGQPLKHLADARIFFELYSQDENKAVLTNEYLLSRIQKTGRNDYPLYIPQKRQLAWIRFDARDIPDVFATFQPCDK